MADNTRETTGAPSRRRGLRAATQPEAPAPSLMQPEVDTRGITAGKGRATPGRRERELAEEKSEGVVQRTTGGLLEYFEGVRSEIGKVVWPSREDLRRLTIVVIITLIIASIILGGIALFFTELFRIGLESPAVLMGFMVVMIAIGFFVDRWYTRRQSALRRY